MIATFLIFQRASDWLFMRVKRFEKNDRGADVNLRKGLKLGRTLRVVNIFAIKIKCDQQVSQYYQIIKLDQLELLNKIINLQHMFNLVPKTFEPSKTRSNPSQQKTQPQKPSKPLISDSQAQKILNQVSRLSLQNQNIQSINLLRALKQNLADVKNTNFQIIVPLNLGIVYYQVGFLEQAQLQFQQALKAIKEKIDKLINNRNKEQLRCKYEELCGRIQLQLCILYSQLGKHDLALEKARNACRVNYYLIYGMCLSMHANHAKYTAVKSNKKHPDYNNLEDSTQLLNHMSILSHLIHTTKDLRTSFPLQKPLEQPYNSLLQKPYKTPSQTDIEVLYSTIQTVQHLWIFKNKILDQIQLSLIDKQYFQYNWQQNNKNQVISKIVYLSISLYCYSTETRFIEKKSREQYEGVSGILDSEHWLSRSLEIAYTFLPAEAPILNQILTVHDRFHGLDKQTIPEDEEVAGFYKVLKPLSKPKSTYSCKNNNFCSPIMIRIRQQAIDLGVPEKQVIKNERMQRQTAREYPINKNRLQIDNSDKSFPDVHTKTHNNLEYQSKNNKIKGIPISSKKIDIDDSTLSARINLHNTRSTIDNPSMLRGNLTARNPKLLKKREEKLKINYSQLNGKAVIGQDFLQQNEEEQTYQKMEQIQLKSLSERKKKSLQKKRDQSFSLKKPNSTGTTIKLDGGLQLLGKKFEQTGETQFFQKLHNESKMLQAAKIGGNVYINNNINLYISKKQPQSFTQTFVRGQVIKQDKNNVNRRHVFMNRRKPNRVGIPQDF